jgi:uncharacterized membrane protein
VAAWLVLALLALLVWGFWGLFFNLTSRHIDSYSAIVWEVLGATAVAAIVCLGILRWSSLDTGGRGALYGMATGVTYTVGLVLAFAALRAGLDSHSLSSASGRISSVLVLTALYPVVAVALNFLILSEPVSGRQLLALGLAMLAVIIIVTG